MATKDKAQAGDHHSCPLDAEVMAALERIKEASPLVQAQRLQKFLTYIVEETLSGRGDRIIGYTVGVDVFGKPESFDPTTDTIVRVEAGRLRRRLADYYREAGADDPVEIVVPKGAYVPQFRYRAEDRVVTATVAPANAAAYPTATPERGPSIAVVPFDNFSGDPNDQFFADGLTEETIANLARFKSLFVFSRSTTSKLVRDGADIRQIHDELGVDFVVEGSIRKTPQAIRVTFQLIDAATDGHILAEQFTKSCTPDGIFEIQDGIAQAIAGRIADHHGPLGRYVARAGREGRSNHWETYSWITRFYDYYSTHDPEKHLEVRDGIARALEQDVDSSDGWAALSIILLDEYRLHMNERASVPARDQALDHALRAATCDPENAFAYHALALAYFHNQEFSEFRTAAERAMHLNSGHTDLLADIGHSYALLGDWERGIPLLNRAMELSPVHPGWYHHAPAWHHHISGNPQAALDELKKGPMPGFHWHHAFLAAFHAELGDKKEAERHVSELLAVVPDFCGAIRREIEIWSIHKELAEAMISSWRKAGLKIV